MTPMDLERLRVAIASGDPARAMPALAQLRGCPPSDAEPLLLLGLRQQAFTVRALSCSGLGWIHTPACRQALVEALEHDSDPNVRAEAANALVKHGYATAWPLLLETFRRDTAWLLRCSILSALVELPDVKPEHLLELAGLAIDDLDGTVRLSGAECLGWVVRGSSPQAAVARELLLGLLQDPDYRVVAAALNGTQP